MSANGKRQRTIPRVALNQSEAAIAVGMSVEFFRKHVAPEVPVIRVGQLRLYRPRDLDAWAEKNSAITLEGLL